MTEAQDLNRAARAQELQENPILNEALESWEKEITETWKNSSAADQAARESMFLMLKAAQNFRRYVQTVVDTGKLIKARQIHTPTLVDRVRGIG